MRSLSRARALAASAAAIVVAVVAASCGGAAFEAGTPADAGAASDGAKPEGDGAGSFDGPRAGDAADGAAAPGEGGTDAGDAGDAGGSGAEDAGDGAPSAFSCETMDASTFFFCADFDHVAAVGDGWGATLSVSGGTNAFDTVNYRSPPNGYAAATPAITSEAAFAALEQTLSSGASLSLSFSLLVRDIDGTVGASATLVSLQVSTGEAPLILSLVLTGNALTLQQDTTAEDGGAITQSDSVGGIGTTAWTRVQIDLDRSVVPWGITVKRDATVKLTTSALAAPTDTGVQLTVGVVYVAPPSAGYAATYDDVILQAMAL